MGFGVFVEQAVMSRTKRKMYMGFMAVQKVGTFSKVVFCVEYLKNKKATPILESLVVIVGLFFCHPYP